MAIPFVRVDLSDEARDFRPFALEPGVPMLDRSNANAKILFRWLGGMAAEPQWEGDSVNFYVQDDRGGRLEEVVCQPASEADLKNPLQNDLATLKDRIEQAKPETATERAVKKMLRRSFQQLTDERQWTDLDCYFFKYRDVQGRWRLVWCWGYQRLDQEAAPSAVCPRGECNLLFVRRPGRSPKCPGCETGLPAKPRRKVPRKTAALLGLLVLLIAALLLYWVLRPKGPIVTPDKLDMVVGQITDLKIEPPGDAPVRITSPDPAVVEITKENRLIARSQGALEVEVARGNWRGTVKVTVTAAEFQSIAVAPARVVVAVDDSVRARVMARIAGEKPGREIEIAPDLLSCQQRPSPRYADFDPASMELRGLMPTESSSPQTLAFALKGRRCSAPVQVVLAPFELALAPPGPIDLPLGQQMRLESWATYEKDGRRVQVLPSRLTFEGRSPPAAAPGLELRGNKVAALKPGAGPMEVYAGYFDRRSPAVVFRSVAAGPVTLRLDVDRTLRLAGETGHVTLSGGGPAGDVDLVPDLADYQSSDPDVLKIDGKTGAFRAMAQGEVTVTGSHPASGEPAGLKLRVCDPAEARLVFDPGSIQVAVDEVARLPLWLEVEHEGKVDRAPLVGPGVGHWNSQPQSVGWSPPMVLGIRPAKGVQLTAGYFPVLSSTATAQVEVLPVIKPAELRVVPAEISLAPGQTLPLAVEARLPDDPSDRWREIRPGAGAWTVPSGLTWTPGSEALRPTAALPEGATGQFKLQVEYRGKQASSLITAKQQGPNPNDPGVAVLLVREPPGEYLPIGAGQRYSIVVEKDQAQEPASGVKWPEDFENEYVRWAAPVLTAKKPGYQQWLRAEVDGRTVLFHTSTYQPSDSRQPLPREGQPVAVRILSDQDQPVQFPVGAEFDDFYVEAEYADGFKRLVTKKATLRTPESPQNAFVTPNAGRLLGIRPGRTTISAEFEGVRSDTPSTVDRGSTTGGRLEAVVTATLEVDRIAVVPDVMTLLPGESVAMDVVGYKGGRSVGIITGLGDSVWTSSDPQVAPVEGRYVTGVNLGQSSVTAELAGIVSQPAPVNVVSSITDALLTDSRLIRIRVGQGIQIGTDLSITRGEMDISRQCTVTPALPRVVRYVPEIHSLLGVAPGASAVAFTFGDGLANVMVEVLPAAGPIDGEVIVEPSRGALAAGQALDLRVLVVTPDGQRIDRTASAFLASSDPKTLVIQGSRACAVGPGTSEITARVPGTSPFDGEPASTTDGKVGRAYLVVNDEEFSELIVEPPLLAMSTGDVARLRILGRAPGGTYEIFPQPDLTLTPGGPNPEAVQITGPGEVRAVAAGQASIGVTWRNRLSRQVPVQVNDDPLTDLRIEPARTVIHPGLPLVYQVTGMRGGRRRVLGPEHGVQLFVGNQEVAQVVDDLTVRANNPGRTSVVAGVGRQQAEATLEVTPGRGPGGGEVLLPGPGGVPYYGPGGGYWSSGPGGYWDGGYRYWDGHRWISGPGYVEEVLVPPRADVVGLSFDPEMLRLSPNSPPTPVRVFERLADGHLGREVTAEENLELTEPPRVVTVEKTPGGPLLRPVGQGEVRLSARLGELVATPLFVQVGEAVPGLARLRAAPDPLTLWPGQQGTFGSVTLDPGAGQMPFEIDYRISPAANQGVVASAGDQTIRALADGTTQVVVTAVDPGGTYDGLATTATVQVTGADPLRIEPSVVSLRVGQATPPMAVSVQQPGGLSYQVPAALRSENPAILAPDPERPGRFVGKSFGQTQVVADYRGRHASAVVAVTGKRFLEVVPTGVDEGKGDFDLTLTVLAEASEGAIQYRIYLPGETPPENWKEAQLRDGKLQVGLQSPRIAREPYGTLYHLVLEARDLSGGSVEQFQYEFELGSIVIKK